MILSTYTDSDLRRPLPFHRKGHRDAILQQKQVYPSPQIKSSVPMANQFKSS